MTGWSGSWLVVDWRKDVNTTTKYMIFQLQVKYNTRSTNMGRAELVAGSGGLVPSWPVEQIDQYVSTVATIQYLIEPILGNCDRLDTNTDRKPL